MSRGGHRESLTPMDFEYDNKQGPVDYRSPFMNITNTPKREHMPSQSSPPAPGETSELSTGPSFGQPGPQSQFTSPTKAAFATPSRLREAALNFPQSGSRPLPSLPPHTNAWNTPRTPAPDYDFSSGGETPNTPAQDSEQATPDTQMAGKMRMLMDSPSPKKGGRRQSFFGRIKNSFSPSPAKESMREIEKEVSRKHYNDKMENRVAKRRSTRERSDRSKKKHMVLRDDDHDETDNELAQVHKAAPTELSRAQQTYGASVAGFFHWIEAHPGLPSVLSWYMQFTVNAFLALSFMYIMYLVYNGVMADINIESNKHASELMVEIAHCVKNYRENRCEPETRVPAMEMACGNWETCMSRDPNKLARASVTVKTFAGIINSFFEEFSYKSMVCSFILIFRCGWLQVQLWKQPTLSNEVREEMRAADRLNSHLLAFYSQPAPLQHYGPTEPLSDFHQPLINYHTPTSPSQQLRSFADIDPNNRSFSPSSSSAASTSRTGPSDCSASSTLNLKHNSTTTSLHHRKHLIASIRTTTSRTASKHGRHHIRHRMRGEVSYRQHNRRCCSIRRVRRRCRVMRTKGRGRN